MQSYDFQILPIKHYYNKYFITSNGNVLFDNVDKIKIISPIYRHGYLCVSFSFNKRVITESIHRLVATHFIPNPEKKPCINHLNGIKSDNNVSNLEWVTHKENTAHAIKTGLVNINEVVDNLHNGKRNCNPISELDVSTIMDMHCAGFSINHISKIFNISKPRVSRLTKTHKRKL